MPNPALKPTCPVQYWYGDEEQKERRWDIDYIESMFPETEFVENQGMGHAE